MEFKHELVIPNQDLPFRMFIFEGREGNYRVVKHWHRSLEVFLVLEGAIGFRINSREYQLHEREFVIVNSNEIHSIESPDPNLTIVLQIPLKLFGSHLDDGNYILFQNNNKEHDPKIVNLVERMYRIYEEKQEGYELLVRSQIYLLLYILVSKYQVGEIGEDIRKQNRQLNKLSGITAYIRDNYARDLTLEHVAETFGYSSAYLSRMFRKYADINFKQFLQNVRVEHGYQELMNSEHTISEIAGNNGFPNSKAFAKAFMQRYGRMPSEFRKNVKKMP